MTPEDRKAAAETGERDGPTAAAWEAFARWADRWRRMHPDDDRTDLELIDVYAGEPYS